ncbi:DNA-formamidopyrimidine glycosylase [Thalassobacillus sp. CUG 92003]|uniref:DNA-formamidopyrimidine glycosylase n=1 Tax=Thalassobacillus sp. CUG 92003 TaxID=2736641 RepID=UPI0015E67078|nr:DNA-formamidopyrimidine glycosylase [Thalassobacillus sp. CUG 92003]
MPELPEVETVRQTLRERVIGQTIDETTILWDNIIKRPGDPDEFKMLLQGQTIHEINRKGKFLLFDMDDVTLVSHLRMEGKYAVYPKEEVALPHTHILFHFASGTDLRYQDVRKFGTMHVFNKGDAYDNKPLNTLGPDPFDPTFTASYLFEKLKHTTRQIKSVLLDQTVVAGLGNIYVDETLFRSYIHPERTAHTLTYLEAERVRQAAIDTLQEALAQGGTTIRSYVNSEGASGSFQKELFVYGQEASPCKQCGEEIIKIKVSNRGTHLCPVCQQ